MHLGDFIKHYRTINNLSMGDFAELSGISKAYISVLEKNKDPRNNKPITPSIHIIKKVADVINIPFDELFSQLDDDIIVSFKDNVSKQPILDIYNKLEEVRQNNVLDYATEQLEEQQSEDLEESIMASNLGNKKIMAQNIRRYMDKLGMNAKEFALALDFKYTTVLDWLNAKTYPRIDKIEIMANYFNIEKSDLVEEYSPPSSHVPQDVSKDALKLDKELHSDNHTSWIHYGNTLLEEQQSEHLIEETSATYYTYDFYPQPASAGTGQYLGDTPVEQIDLPVDVKADFVIPITGDSMEPDYHNGDYVFIKLSVELKNNDIGVFELQSDSYIKQLLITPNGAFLHSLNDKYEDIPIHADSDFRIIGRVVGKYQN